MICSSADVAWGGAPLYQWDWGCVILPAVHSREVNPSGILYEPLVSGFFSSAWLFLNVWFSYLKYQKGTGNGGRCAETNVDTLYWHRARRETCNQAFGAAPDTSRAGISFHFSPLLLYNLMYWQYFSVFLWILSSTQFSTKMSVEVSDVPKELLGKKYCLNNGSCPIFQEKKISGKSMDL